MDRMNRIDITHDLSYYVEKYVKIDLPSDICRLIDQITYSKYNKHNKLLYNLINGNITNVIIPADLIIDFDWSKYCNNESIIKNPYIHYYMESVKRIKHIAFILNIPHIYKKIEEGMNQTVIKTKDVSYNNGTIKFSFDHTHNNNNIKTYTMTILA